MPKDPTLHSYYVKDFSGGENRRDTAINLLPTELSDTLNVVPSTRGAVTRRSGAEAYNDTAPTAKFYGATCLCRFYRETGTDAFLGVGVSGVTYLVMSIATSGASTDLGSAGSYTLPFVGVTFGMMCPYGDRVYGSHWSNTAANRKNFVVAEDPGTSSALLAWAMGVTTPTNAPTVALQATGSLTTGHKFYYKCSFWYGPDGAHGESNPSAASSQITTTAGNNTVRVTFFGGGLDHATATAALNAGVKKVYIYRTENDGTDYYLLKAITLTDASDAYWDDDGTEGDGYPDDLDLFTTPETDQFGHYIGKHLCVHGDRLCMGGIYDGTDTFPKRVRWSRVGHPDVWNAQSYADAPAEHGEIMGLRVIGGSLYVFYESAIARLTVHSDTEYSFETVTAEAGVRARESLVVGSDGGRECAFFVSPDARIYRFDGFAAQPISHDIETEFQSLDFAGGLGSPIGCWDGESYYVTASTTELAIGSRLAEEYRYNTRVQKQSPGMSYATGTWWRQRYGWGDDGPYRYARFNGGSDDGLVVFGRYLSTTLCKANTGNDDDGTDINAYFQTAYLDCGTPDIKQFKHIKIVAECDTALTVTWETDGHDGTWGSQSGTFNLTTGTNPIATVQHLSQAYGRHIRIKVEGTDGDDPWTVYSVEIMFTVERKARGVHG